MEISRLGEERRVRNGLYLAKSAPPGKLEILMMGKYEYVHDLRSIFICVICNMVVQLRILIMMKRKTFLVTKGIKYGDLL